MKILPHILIAVISFNGYSQKDTIVSSHKNMRGKIVVRKKSENKNISSLKSLLDSVSTSVNKVYYNTSRSKTVSTFTAGSSLSNTSYTEISSSIFAKKRKLLITNKKFNIKRDAKRKEKRGRLHYFEPKYRLFRIDTIKTEFHSIHEVIDSFNTNTNKYETIYTSQPGTQKKILNSIITTNYLCVLNDTVINNNKSEGVTDILTVFFMDTTQIKWRMTSPKKINKNRYQIEFDLKNLNKNTITFIKNNSDIITCSYKIKNRYIYIENPPEAELSKGKFNTKKTSLKFRIHKTTHEFKTAK